MTDRFIEATRNVLTHSQAEASRVHAWSTSPYEIGVVDLVTAIVREPDVLAHLVADRECAVDFRALREQRTGRSHRPRAADDAPPHGVQLREQGYSGEVKLSDAMRQTIDDARAEIVALADSGELPFLRWDTHSARVRAAREQMAAAGFDPWSRLPDDPEWQRKVDARNYRYAALRALLARALAADPAGVSRALQTLGIDYEDLQATFDSLASHLSWPNVDG